MKKLRSNFKGFATKEEAEKFAAKKENGIVRKDSGNFYIVFYK